MGFQTGSLASQSLKPEKFISNSTHQSLLIENGQKLPLSLNGSVRPHMGHTRRLAPDSSPNDQQFLGFNGDDCENDCNLNKAG